MGLITQSFPFNFCPFLLACHGLRGDLWNQHKFCIKSSKRRNGNGSSPRSYAFNIQNGRTRKTVVIKASAQFDCLIPSRIFISNSFIFNPVSFHHCCPITINYLELRLLTYKVHMQQQWICIFIARVVNNDNFKEKRNGVSGKCVNSNVTALQRNNVPKEKKQQKSMRALYDCTCAGVYAHIICTTLWWPMWLGVS